MYKWRNPASCDVANLILGALLFVSPWFFRFSPGVESWNAWVCGGIIVVLSIAALSAFAEWEEWLNFIVGLWILVSPWALKFSDSTNALRTAVIIGAIVAVIAAVELWVLHRSPPRLTASRSAYPEHPAGER
jgi:SPW repeat